MKTTFKGPVYEISLLVNGDAVQVSLGFIGGSARIIVMSLDGLKEIADLAKTASNEWEKLG